MSDFILGGGLSSFMQDPNAIGDDIATPFPNTIAETEELILKFYNAPTKSIEHGQIDKILVQLQKSPQGFQIADALLKSQHSEVQFYGARTFIVKINRDLRSLDDSAKAEVLSRLLTWLQQASINNYGNTTSKLCSCLVAYFINTDGKWQGFVVDVVNLFLGRDAVQSTDMIRSALGQSDAIARIESREAKTLLFYIQTLVEEVRRIEPETPQAYLYHEAIATNLEIIMAILEQCFGSIGALEMILAEAAIQCYYSLVLWARGVPKHASKALSRLRPLTPVLMSLYEDPRFYEIVSEFLVDVIENYPAFFTDDLYSMVTALIAGPQAEFWLQKLIHDPASYPGQNIGNLLIAYGEARMESIVANPSDLRIHEVLERLFRLTKCEDIPIEADLIIVEVLDFWANFVQALIELQFEQEKALTPEEWLQWGDEVLSNVISSFVEKARYPSDEITSEWDSGARSEFNTFRVDVQNFVASAYPLLGLLLVSRFIHLAEISRRNRNWHGVEIALFCLNGLADSVVDSPAGDDDITTLFISISENIPSLFEEFGRLDTCASVSTQKSAIAFIGLYAPVLQRHQAHVPIALQCLFSWLSVPAISVASAKSISTLCLSARTTVVGFAPELFSHYQSYANSPKRDFAVQERLAGAVAAVIQACASQPIDNNAPIILQGLLDLIGSDIDMSVKINPFATGQAQNLGLFALRCLQNVGKAFRVPDQIVDLEADESNTVDSLWTRKPEFTNLIQQRILGLCYSVLSISSGEEAVESVCQILRAGYTEIEPGPFVFPLEATESFMKQCSLSTPRIGMVLSTVSVLLNKNRTAKGQTSQIFALGCYKHVRSMISPFFQGNPSTDPEVASITLDFIRAYIPAYFDLLLNSDEPEDLSHTLEFALNCLGSAEIMPKRSAAAFWAAFMNESPLARNQEALEACINQYGRLLTTILVQQIGGAASRSELDDICEPLKKIVFKGGIFRGYLQEAMASLPTRRVSDAEKRTALEQILRLRGGARTNKIVKDFWTACRGSFQLK